MIDLRRHLAAIEGLFPMPQVMARAVARARDPNATVEEVAEVLVLDPSVVQTVVRMSNSSYYGFDTSSASLAEAIQRVGFRELLRLLGSSIAREVYQRELAHYRMPPEIFWESSIAAALHMEALGRQTDLPGEDAYLAGLMREIGMIVIDHALTQERRAAQWDCTTPVRAWETDVAGVDHAAAGRMILERWKFSPEVAAAVGTQWDEHAEGSALAVALRLTNRVLERSGCDFSLPYRPDAGDAPLLARLGLEAADAAASLSAARARFLQLRRELAAS